MKKQQIQTNLLGRKVKLLTVEEMWPGSSYAADESCGIPLASILRHHGGKEGEIVSVYREDGSTQYSVIVDGNILEGLFSSSFRVVPIEQA